MAQLSEARVLTPGGRPGLQELWASRELLRNLVVRDLKIKYQRSVLGFFWTLLNPALTAGILIGVFSYVIRLEVEGYWAFLLSGYFVWNFIQQSLNSAARVLEEHGGLLRSVAFPSEILILSAVLSKLVEFLLEMILVILVLTAAFHGRVPGSLSLFPLLVLAQLVLTTGLMYPIAAAAVLFKDVQHALPLVVTSLFYVTPVFYPVEMIPEAARPFFLLNPFVGLLRLYHLILYEGRFPSPSLLFTVLAVAVGVFAVGYAVLKRYEAICIEIA